MHPPSLLLTALSRVYPANLPSRLPPGMHLSSPTLINHYSHGIPKSLDGWTGGRKEEAGRIPEGEEESRASCESWRMYARKGGGG